MHSLSHSANKYEPDISPGVISMGPILTHYYTEVQSNAQADNKGKRETFYYKV